MRGLLVLILEVIGAVLVVVGVSEIYRPLGVISAGALLLGLAVAGDR